jgi:hypothetical protein
MTMQEHILVAMQLPAAERMQLAAFLMISAADDLQRDFINVSMDGEGGAMLHSLAFATGDKAESLHRLAQTLEPNFVTVSHDNALNVGERETR